MKKKLLESDAVSYSMMILTIAMLVLSMCATSQGQDTLCVERAENIKLKHELSLLRTGFQQEQNRNKFLTENIIMYQKREPRHTISLFVAIFSTCGLIFITTTLKNEH